MSINILVTGANGQLGKTLKDESSNLKGEYCFTFVSKAELDITNPKQIEVFLEEKEYDYCINCAAYTKVEQAEDSAKTAFKVNAEAVLSSVTLLFLLVRLTPVNPNPIEASNQESCL